MEELMGQFGGQRGVGDKERQGPPSSCFHPKEKPLLSLKYGTHHPRPGPPVGAGFLA